MTATLQTPSSPAPSNRTSQPRDVIVAWDSETVPLPFDSLSEPQRRRLDLEVNRLESREPLLGEAALRNKAASLHPELGRVCVISAVRASDGVLQDPKSWVAPNLVDEAAAISSFLKAASQFRNVRWVTMNGKGFDVPFLIARIAHHRLGTLMPRNGMFDTYPFKQRPHADLANLWRMPSSLDSLCDHLQVETPKGDMCGADVAQAVEDGRIDDVRRYCEGDVIATANAFLALGSLIDA